MASAASAQSTVAARAGNVRAMRTVVPPRGGFRSSGVDPEFMGPPSTGVVAASLRLRCGRCNVVRPEDPDVLRPHDARVLARTYGQPSRYEPPPPRSSPHAHHPDLRSTRRPPPRAPDR